MQDQTRLYPFLFQPIYKEKVWGGRALEKLGKRLPGEADTCVGESWEIADLVTTSASGGGGSAEHSVIANGPLAGQTIRELIQAQGDALLGPGAPRSDDGGFPLLIKFLDARENLSVQVHPSPDYADANPDAHLKSESWYVVDADPGAVIYKGLKPGVTPDQLQAALKLNTDAAVVPLLNAIEVTPGDCHYLPSGTLHALGAGVVVAEVQTPSDTTFRVYDWGRTDRALHVEQALACIDFATTDVATTTAAPASVRDLSVGVRQQTKARCDYFQEDELAYEPGTQVKLPITEAEIWIVIEGAAEFASDDSETVIAQAGETVLLPASIGSYNVRFPARGRCLRITLP